MRPSTGIIVALLGLATSATYAEDTPEWDRVKTCFDSNLPTLIRSNESIEAVFKAARTICDDAIDDALKETFTNIAASETGPKTAVETALMTTYFTHRLDAALFAYTVKFKAVGGPITLKY